MKKRDVRKGQGWKMRHALIASIVGETIAHMEIEHCIERRTISRIPEILDEEIHNGSQIPIFIWNWCCVLTGFDRIEHNALVLSAANWC